jgi:hypothetical protein
MRYLFDLDHTVICSNHRKVTKTGGDLDLAHWIENCTPEKIALDSLLPLAVTMRKAYFSGIHEIVVVTARVLGVADYDFFMENNLPYHHMLDRPNGCTMGDADLKEIQLRIFAHNQGISWAKFAATSVCYDDNHAVLVRMADMGIAIVDAVEMNQAMAL